MRLIISALAGIFVSVPVWATDVIQSDCSKSELRTLRSKKILEKIAAESKVNSVDCTVLKGNKLLVVYSLDTPTAVETHAAVFTQSSLSPDSRPSFLSESLGFDSYLMMAKGKKRLLFVMPGENSKDVEFYTNTQVSSGDTEFKKHKLNLSSKSLTDVEGKSFKIDEGQEPKIFNEKGKWRAILKGKIVDL